MDSEDVRRVFTLLAGPTRMVHWTAKSPISHAAIGRYVVSADDLIKCAEQQEGWDFYVNLNPSIQARVKPSKEQMHTLQCVGLDIDPFPKQELDISKCVEILERGMHKLAGNRKCYSIVHSGRGLWLWLFVTPMTINSTFTVEDADLIVKATTDWFIEQNNELTNYGILDTASAEVSRIARCPGTVNMKTKKRAYFLLDHEPTELVDIGVLKRLVPAYLEHRSKMFYPNDFGLTDSSIMALAPAMNLTSRQFVLCGVDSEVESRHRRFFAAAKNLLELGLDEATAAPILFLGASRCRPNLLMTDPHYAPLTVRTIWSKRKT